MNLRKVVNGFVLAACIGVAGFASAATVGADAIDRVEADGWSNFVLGLTSETFAFSGVVTDWSVYAANAGTLGMLLLRPTGGDDYSILGADFETINTPGLNSFTFSPDTGSANVQAGDILGLFIGSAKVDFDFSSDGTANWCGSNGCITDANTDLAAGNTLSLTGGPQGRVYSANVNVVPLPAAVWLFASALGIFGYLSKRKANA